MENIVALNRPPLLLKFYKEYVIWNQSGAGDHPVFTCYEGLCFLLEIWCHHNKLSYAESSTCKIAMRAAFKTTKFPCSSFPFNLDACHFYAECEDGGCHLNKARLQWCIDNVTLGV